MQPKSSLSESGLFSEEFGDIYFSQEDGLAEKTHVFIKGNDLDCRWQNYAGEFTIIETGFGSGLNFMLSQKLWQKTAASSARLNYISIEKYPLSAEKIRAALKGWPELGEPEFLEQYNPSSPKNIITIGSITLTIYFADIKDALNQINTKADAWFLDGFAPSKNPEMWSDFLYQKMAELTSNGGTFATYTSAGNVRRGLMNNGFLVEKIRGFGKKREMLKGVYP